MHIRPYVLALCMVGALRLAACAPAPAPEASPFARLTGAMGCVIEQVTSEAYDEYQFQGISDDGRWLAYAWTNGEDAEGNPVGGAYRLDLATGEKTELPASMSNAGSFSADGFRLIGAQPGLGGRTDLYEYTLGTERVVVILPDSASDYLPSYSLDGQTLLFNSYRSGNSELYLYEPGQDVLRQLTNYEGYDAHGEFSPDNSKILFHRMVSERAEGGYDFDLYAYDLASGVETRLTASPYEESYGSWALDGQTFVFSSDVEERPEQHNLYIMQPDSAVIQITDGDWKDSYAYWLRDGSYIYFNSDRSGNTDIYRIPMKGSACVQANQP